MLEFWSDAQLEGPYFIYGVGYYYVLKLPDQLGGNSIEIKSRDRREVERMACELVELICYGLAAHAEGTQTVEA